MRNKCNRYNVLKPPFNLDEDGEFTFTVEDYYGEVKPAPVIFNRAGIYLDRYEKIAWVEFGNGEAFFVDYDHYRFDLEVLHAHELRPEDINGLREIVKSKLATNEQRSLFYFYEAVVMQRNTYRNARLWRIKTLGK